MTNSIKLGGERGEIGKKEEQENFIFHIFVCMKWIDRDRERSILNQVRGEKQDRKG
jgi:hypothetical protein